MFPFSTVAFLMGSEAYSRCPCLVHLYGGGYTLGRASQVDQGYQPSYPTCLDSKDVTLAVAGCCPSPQQISVAQRFFPGEEEGHKYEALRRSA